MDEIDRRNYSNAYKHIVAGGRDSNDYSLYSERKKHSYLDICPFSVCSSYF